MNKYIILLLVIACMTTSCSRSGFKRATDVKNTIGIIVKEVQGKSSGTCAYLVKFPSSSNNGYGYEWFHLSCGDVKIGDKVQLFLVGEKI